MNKAQEGSTRFLLGLVILGVLLFLVACSSGSPTSSSTSSQTNTTPAKTATASTTGAPGNTATSAAGATGKGSISAKIDGSNWASVVTAAQYSGAGLIISGSDTSSPPRAFGMGVAAQAAGTYQASLPVPAANASWTIGSATWQASAIGGSGTVIITSLTSTGAAGTFSFTLVPVPGTSASGNKVITDGVFNVTFASPVSIPTVAPAGSAPMTAQVNGQAWNGQYKISASLANQFLSMVVFDGKGSTITFGIGKVAGPGTYSLAFGNPEGSSAIYTDAAGKGWGTAFQGGSGSITISVLTSGRAAGTFAFDAVPATGGGTGTVHVTNGQFDITF